MQTIETKSTPAPAGLSESCSAKHDAVLSNFFRAVLEADRVIEQRRAQREQTKEMPHEKAA